MNPSIENELRLHVMINIHGVKRMLNQPIDKTIYMIKLQPLQFLTNFIDAKSIFILVKANTYFILNVFYIF